MLKLSNNLYSRDKKKLESTEKPKKFPKLRAFVNKMREKTKEVLGKKPFSEGPVAQLIENSLERPGIRFRNTFALGIDTIKQEEENGLIITEARSPKFSDTKLQLNTLANLCERSQEDQIVVDQAYIANVADKIVTATEALETLYKYEVNFNLLRRQALEAMDTEKKEDPDFLRKMHAMAFQQAFNIVRQNLGGVEFPGLENAESVPHLRNIVLNIVTQALSHEQNTRNTLAA